MWEARFQSNLHYDYTCGRKWSLPIVSACDIRLVDFLSWRDPLVLQRGSVRKAFCERSVFLSLKFQWKMAAQVSAVLASAHKHIKMTAELQNTHHSEPPEIWLKGNPTAT